MTGEIQGLCGEAARPCEQGRWVDNGHREEHACSQPVWHQSPKTTHQQSSRARTCLNETDLHIPVSRTPGPSPSPEISCFIPLCWLLLFTSCKVYKSLLLNYLPKMSSYLSPNSRTQTCARCSNIPGTSYWPSGRHVISLAIFKLINTSQEDRGGARMVQIIHGKWCPHCPERTQT